MKARRLLTTSALRPSSRGIDILRDVTGLGLGESIIRFMQKIGSSDRVIVILSEKYLKSPYCMFELLEVWRNCRMEDDGFSQADQGFSPTGCANVEPARASTLRRILERAVHGT